MTKTSSLRVYLPAQPGTGPRSRADEPVEMEGIVGEYGFLSESMRDDAFVADWGGRRYVCPRLPRLRVLEGVLAMHRAYVTPGGGSLVPADSAIKADQELRRLIAATPGVRSHVLTAAWHVPVRWFVPFQPEERHLIKSEFRTRVRYRTSMHLALERLETAGRILEDVNMPVTVTEELGELTEWLGSFSSMAMIELDYGTVSDLFNPEDLFLDDSVEQIWESLGALGRGDWEEAGERYAAVITRWALAHAITYSN